MLFPTRIFRIGVVALLTACLGAGIVIVSIPGPVSAQTAPNLSLAVPLYFLDKDAWERATKSPAVTWIIAHPDVVELGKNYQKDDTLAGLITQAKAAGKKVAIYNSARYDKEDWEPTADRADVLLQTYPNVDGIFFDEVNYDQCDKYSALAKGANGKKGFRDRHPDKLLMLNPGAPILACYEGDADVYLNLERAAGDIGGWEDNVNLPGNYSAYSWMFKAPLRPEIWQFVHTVPPAQIEATIDRLATHNAGVVYVTPNGLPNPYDKLPSEDIFTRMEKRVLDYQSGRVPLPAVAAPKAPATTTTRPAATTAVTTVTTKPVATTKPVTKKAVVKKAAVKKAAVKKASSTH